MLLTALVGVAAGLRFFQLDADSLWFDTAHSVAVAGQPTLGDVLQGVVNDSQSPLYFFLLHFWMKLSQTEFWIRSLSALIGVAVVAMTYMVGKELFSEKSGLLAAALTAFSSYQVYYSRYPRSYILLALITLFVIYFLFRALRENRRRYWALLGLSLLAALYTHAYGLFLLPAQAIFALFYALRSDRRLLIPWGVTQIGVLVGFALWLPVVWQHLVLERQGIDSWIPDVSAQSFVALYNRLWFKTRVLDYAWVDIPLRFVRYLLTGVLVNGLIAVRWRWSKLIALAFLVIPVAIAYLVSDLWRPVWVPRYFVFVSGPFYLLLAASISGFRLPWLGWDKTCRAGLAGLALLLAGPPLFFFYTHEAFRHYDVRAASAWIRQGYQEGDLIVHLNYQGYLPSVWYNRQAAALASEKGNHSIPCLWRSMPRTWCDSAPYRETYAGSKAEFERIVSAMPERLWVVILYQPHERFSWEAEVQGLIQRSGYRQERVQEFRGAKAYLLANTAVSLGAQEVPSTQMDGVQLSTPSIIHGPW